jgi:hypothetical protein
LSEFVIEIAEEVSTLEAPVSVLERVKQLMQKILAELRRLLVGNLPPWPTVELAVTAAYAAYIRPLAIPDMIDDILLKALLAKAKEVYAEFA